MFEEQIVFQRRDTAMVRFRKTKQEFEYRVLRFLLFLDMKFYIFFFYTASILLFFIN